MSNYVEDNYVENDYVENNNNSGDDVSVDSALIEELIVQNKEIIAQNNQIKESMSNMINSVEDSLTNIGVIVQNLIHSNSTTSDDVKNSVSQIKEECINYIKNNVPFVDDKGLSVFTKGTNVSVDGLEGFYTVESSSFLSIDYVNFKVIYTVKRIYEDGTVKFSDFPSERITKQNPDEYYSKKWILENFISNESLNAEYILKSDCPNVNGA